MKYNILLIDNYDSFTYNLAQYLWELGYKTTVIRNDKITIQEIKEFKPSHLVISPGPGTPDQAGISLEVIKEFHATVPILGICLGHQSIAQYFGAEIVRGTPIHGKVSSIKHSGNNIFKNINNPLEVTRYHSLIVNPETIDNNILNITANSLDDDYIMAIEHKSLPVYGMQFHPESIKTEQGHRLLENFVEIAI